MFADKNSSHFYNCQGLRVAIPLQSRQSVPQSPRLEYVLTQMSVGHEPQKRVCNTMRPATELVAGSVVGHFGDGRADEQKLTVNYPISDE